MKVKSCIKLCYYLLPLTCWHVLEFWSYLISNCPMRVRPNLCNLLISKPIYIRWELKSWYIWCINLIFLTIPIFDVPQVDDQYYHVNLPLKMLFSKLIIKACWSFEHKLGNIVYLLSAIYVICAINKMFLLYVSSISH